MATHTGYDTHAETNQKRHFKGPPLAVMEPRSARASCREEPASANVVLLASCAGDLPTSAGGRGRGLGADCPLDVLPLAGELPGIGFAPGVPGSGVFDQAEAREALQEL